MALDEFRDGLDPHGVTLLVDGFDLLGSREAPPHVFHRAVGELHEIGLEHFEEAERALAAVEAGESEAAAKGPELRLDILQVLGLQQSRVPAELESEESLRQLRALDVLGDEVREFGFAQRVFRKVDAVCGYGRAGRRPGPGFLTPARKAAHDPAVDVREQPVLLQHGKERSMLQEYRLLPYVDRWVVSRLASWSQESRARTTPGSPVPANGVNLSEDTLREPKFAEFVAKNIQGAKLPEGFFTFELGWDTALLQAEQLKNIQAQLGPLGCRFTFAGFDGSEGSFSFLKVLKPDFVKLTYGTVKDVGRGLAASEKVEAINQKCHAMGIKTIAEFVESHEVLDQLRLIEVDSAQGLIIGGPQKLA